MNEIELAIPYYRSPAYLREAVASVLAQSDPHWRLVVVEDGPSSEDFDVEAWLASLDDSRVRYVGSRRRLGIAGSFQRALEATSAEHVVLLGQDDRLLPSYVSDLRRLVDEHPDAALFQLGVRVIDGDGQPTRPLGDRVKDLLRPRGPALLGGEELLRGLCEGNWLYFPSLGWNRAAALRHGFRDDMSTALDLDLIARIVLDGGTLAFDPTIAFEYRRHSLSASSRTGRTGDRVDEESRVLDQVALRAAEQGWGRAARAARRRTTVRLHAALCATAAARTDVGAARRLASRALS